MTINNVLFNIDEKASVDYDFYDFLVEMFNKSLHKMSDHEIWILHIWAQTHKCDCDDNYRRLCESMCQVVKTQLSDRTVPCCQKPKPKQYKYQPGQGCPSPKHIDPRFLEEGEVKCQSIIGKDHYCRDCGFGFDPRTGDGELCE